MGSTIFCSRRSSSAEVSRPPKDENPSTEGKKGACECTRRPLFRTLRLALFVRHDVRRDRPDVVVLMVVAMRTTPMHAPLSLGLRAPRSRRGLATDPRFLSASG